MIFYTKYMNEIYKKYKIYVLYNVLYVQDFAVTKSYVHVILKLGFLIRFVAMLCICGCFIVPLLLY